MRHLTLLSLFTVFISNVFAQFVPTNGPTNNGEYSYLWARNDTAFAARLENLWRTTNGGKSWDLLLDKGLPNEVDPRAITVARDMVFIGTNNFARVYSSSDWGETWKAETEGATALWIPTHATSDGNNVLLGGTTFEPHYFDFNQKKWVSSTLSGITHALRYQEDGSLIANVGSVSKGFTHISDDHGKTWTQTKDEPKIPSVGLSGRTFDLIKLGNRLVAISNLNGYNPYYSDDNGDTWTEATGAKTTGLLYYGRKFDKLPDGTLLFNRTGSLMVSKDSGATWTSKGKLLGNDFRVWKTDEILSSAATITDGGSGVCTPFEFVSSGIELHVFNNHVYTFTSDNNSYWHKYSGSAWSKDSVSNYTTLFALGTVYNTSVVDDSLYVCTSSGLLGGTSDAHRSHYQSEFENKRIGAFNKLGSVYLVGTVELRGNVEPSIYISTDGKKTWSKASFSNKIGLGPIGSANYVERFFSHNGNIYADFNGGFARSLDQGKTWEWLGGNNGGNIVSLGSILIRHRDNGFTFGDFKSIEVSEDHGSTWKPILDGIPGYTGQTNYDNYGNVFLVDGTVYLEAIEGGRRLVQFDAANKKWIETTKNSSLPATGDLNQLVELDGTLYADIQDLGVWKLDGSASVSGITKPRVSAYPNPSKAVFQITSSLTDIQVFDIHGEQILKLSKGSNVIDLSNFANGIYLLYGVKDGFTYHFKLIKE